MREGKSSEKTGVSLSRRPLGLTWKRVCVRVQPCKNDVNQRVNE